MQEDDTTQPMVALESALVAAGVLEPLSGDDESARLFMDCELATLIENRFHEHLDPRGLGEEARAVWSARALAYSESLRDPRRDRHPKPFWIIDREERVGTLSLGAQGTFVRVSSLYVFPTHRRRRLGRRALARVHAPPGCRSHTTASPRC